MAKYLIQDIIPKDRERLPAREHKRPMGVTPSHTTHEERALHHDQGKTVRLRARAHKETGREEGAGAPARATRDATTVRTVHNPRTIISDALHSDEKVGVDSATQFFDDSVSSSAATSHARVSREHTKSAPSSGNSFWKNWTPWFVGAILCGMIAIFVMNYFGGATIIVSPKKESVPVDLKLSALKKPLTDELAFSVMKITLEETREVPATGEKTVTAKAKGSIIIYNTQTVAQRLIKNTRFQSTSGKIYRINDSVNVPKAVTKSGKTVLGSLEVVVFADEAGPDYNSPPTDFTLPGLKGSPTFDKVYARGKGAIAGGASGTIKSVSDLDMKTASDDLRVQLETKLRTKARGDLAPSQLSFDKGIIIDLEEAGLSKLPAGSPDKAVVAQSGTLYMVTFDREAFTKTLVQKLVQAYKGETVAISNIESIEFDMSKITGQQLWDLGKLDFTIKGMPNLEWSMDETAIKKALIGTPRQSFNTIMTQFPTVELARATISPLWKRSFPDDEAKIKIEIASKGLKKED